MVILKTIAVKNPRVEIIHNITNKKHSSFIGIYFIKTIYNKVDRWYNKQKDTRINSISGRSKERE